MCVAGVVCRTRVPPLGASALYVPALVNAVCGRDLPLAISLRGCGDRVSPNRTRQAPLNSRAPHGFRSMMSRS